VFVPFNGVFTRVGSCGQCLRRAIGVAPGTCLGCSGFCIGFDSGSGNWVLGVDAMLAASGLCCGGVYDGIGLNHSSL
jgi:hypothetical protein